MEIASLSLRLSISKYDPSWTRVCGAGVTLGAGAGEALLRLFKVNLVRDLERSIPIPESGREGGAGEVGLLEGRKDRGFLRVCMASREYPEEKVVCLFCLKDVVSIC